MENIDTCPVHPYSEEENELEFNTWAQQMYQKNCKERRSFGLLPYESFAAYQKANPEFLNGRWDEAMNF